MECPGCDSNTSTIYAIWNGSSTQDQCPTCGLSGEAMREIVEAKKCGADEALAAKYAEAITRAERAEAEVAKLRRALAAIGSQVKAIGEAK